MGLVEEPAADVDCQEEKGDHVQAEVLEVVEVTRGGFEVFRALCLGDVLEEPDGVVDGGVALQGHEVGHLVNILLEAAKIIARWVVAC